MGNVSVFWLRWCGWCWERVGGRLRPWSGRVVLCYVCFLNCNDICMCVVNKQLGSSSLFLIPFMLTCSMMGFLSLLLLGLCLCVMCL